MNRGLSLLVWGFLAVWLAVSLAALAGMYKLWWDRERLNYWGQSSSDQRRIVWQRSGLPAPVLRAVERADLIWPAGVDYQANGEHTRLSYATYLMIPRIPAGSETYILSDDGSFIPTEEQGQTAADIPGEHGNPAGLLLSVFLIGGIGLLPRLSRRYQHFSIPECFCGGLLFATALIVGSRALLESSVPGFIGVTLVGVLAWLAQIIGALKKGGFRPRLSFLKNQYERSRLNRFMTLCLVLVICLSVTWSFLMAVIVVPDDWDAWAIWGAKAKVLALGQGSLRDVIYFGHGDYPLLWPSIWAFSGWLSGGWEEMWSKGWGSVFFLLCIWEIFVITQRATGDRQLGLLAGALFASVPMVALVSSWGYAEAPFWLLITTCSGCLLHSSARDKQEISATVFAAVLAAAAAYTKNEGVLFAVLAGLWIMVLPGTKRGYRFLVFMGTWMLLYGPWMYYTKALLGLGSHATAGLHVDFDSIDRALGRVRPALEKIGQIWLDIHQWSVVLGGVVLAFAACIGMAEFRRKVLLPCLILLGYFMIVIFHQDDILWLVGTSWNRLTLHAMPLLIIFCVQYMQQRLSFAEV